MYINVYTQFYLFAIVLKKNIEFLKKSFKNYA